MIENPFTLQRGYTQRAQGATAATAEPDFRPPPNFREDTFGQGQAAENAGGGFLTGSAIGVAVVAFAFGLMFLRG